MLLLHSHLIHQCHLVFGKIMNNTLFRVLNIDLYIHTSPLCCMVLLRTSPTSFFGEVHQKSFFFFRSDGWTYQLPVRHSDSDAPWSTQLFHFLKIIWLQPIHTLIINSKISLLMAVACCCFWHLTNGKQRWNIIFLVLVMLIACSVWLKSLKIS